MQSSRNKIIARTVLGTAIAAILVGSGALLINSGSAKVADATKVKDTPTQTTAASKTSAPTWLKPTPPAGLRTAHILGRAGKKQATFDVALGDVSEVRCKNTTGSIEIKTRYVMNGENFLDEQGYDCAKLAKTKPFNSLVDGTSPYPTTGGLYFQTGTTTPIAHRVEVTVSGGAEARYFHYAPLPMKHPITNRTGDEVLAVRLLPGSLSTYVVNRPSTHRMGVQIACSGTGYLTVLGVSLNPTGASIPDPALPADVTERPGSQIVQRCDENSNQVRELSFFGDDGTQLIVVPSADAGFSEVRLVDLGANEASADPESGETKAPPTKSKVVLVQEGYDPVERPTTIGLGASIALTSVEWENWGEATAIGSGDFPQRNCVPSCAAGGQKLVPVAITLSDIGDCDGTRSYLKMTYTVDGKEQTWETCPSYFQCEFTDASP